VISTVIVGIAAVGLAVMYSTGQAYVQGEGENRIALFLAQQRIEQIRALGFAGAAALITDTTDDTEPPASVVEDPICNGITPCPPSPHPGYIRTTSIVCVAPDNFTDREDCPTSPTLPNALWMTVTVQTTPTDPKASPITLQAVMVDR